MESNRITDTFVAKVIGLSNAIKYMISVAYF